MPPEPYYRDERADITIYHGDARSILPELSGDLILSDFPYGIDEQYDVYVDSQINLVELIATLLPKIRQAAPVALITCGVGNMYLFPKPEWVLSWVVAAGAGSGPWGFCCWQPVLAYGKDPYLRDGMGRRPDTLVQYEIAPLNGHPCPKPLAIWKWLLARGSTRASDVIIDPMMGSGTTLRAAKDLGRKAVGIDISEKYCALAVEMLSQEVIDFSKDVDFENDVEPLLF